MTVQTDIHKSLAAGRRSPDESHPHQARRPGTPAAERRLSKAALHGPSDEPVLRLRGAALARRKALSALRDGAVAGGLAIATFVLLTLSVQLWLAAGSPSGTSAGAHSYPHPSYAYVTPDPHP